MHLILEQPMSLVLLFACTAEPPETELIPSDTRRTPAEWEPQAAVWMQWPQSFDGAEFEDAFAGMVEVMSRYEDVHLLAANDRTQASGEEALDGIDVTWHQVPTSSVWMRDNGPRYVELDGELVAQNWEFDGYHDGRPRWMWADDNDNPDDVAAILDLPLERVAMVHERGDLEVNGSDTLLVNWSVVGHRNPEMDRDQASEIFIAALGVERVVFVEGYHPLDVTRGHIDGLARFIGEDEVVIPDDGTALYDTIAEQIADQAPDLTIHRLELVDGDPTLNWLVGDGFVLTGSTGDASADAELAVDLGGYFPDRDIHFTDVGVVWENGGGVHCVTNDQPESR